MHSIFCVARVRVSTGGRGRGEEEGGGVMLVVLLSGINQGFWSHLGFSRQHASIFSYQSKLVVGCAERNVN